MSSNSSLRSEKHDRVSTVYLGNLKQPSNFAIADHRLQLVAEGVTPAVLSLRYGTYELVVSNRVTSKRMAVAARPGTKIDASRFGVPIKTDVPVSCALHRDSRLAERISTTSAALRDRASSSGLIVVGIDETANPTELRAPASKIVLLNAARKALNLPIGSPKLAPSTIWSAPLPPGGYVMRLASMSQSIEMPIWLPAQFQTILFVPIGGGNPRLDSVSFHMVPLGWVWTGFDFPARLLELALSNLRMGGRPFGTHEPSMDFAYLSSINPILGLIRLHDLALFSPRSWEFLRIFDNLTSLIPGHPDITAVEVGGTAYFPPMLASGYAALLRDSAPAPTIESGSLLEATFAPRVRFGPWSTWTTSGEQDLPPDRTFSRVSQRPLGIGLTAQAGIAIGVDVASQVPRALVGAISLYRLLRSTREQAVHVLKTKGDQTAADRLGQYLADLLSVGDMRRVIRALLGLSDQSLAEATSLPVQVVREAIRAINRRLRRTEWRMNSVAGD